MENDIKNTIIKENDIKKHTCVLIFISSINGDYYICKECGYMKLSFSKNTLNKSI